MVLGEKTKIRNPGILKNRIFPKRFQNVPEKFQQIDINELNQKTGGENSRPIVALLWKNGPKIWHISF